MHCTAGVVLVINGTALPVDAEDGEKVMSVARPTLFRTGAAQLEQNCHTHSVIYSTCGCFCSGVLDSLSRMTVGAEWLAHHTAWCFSSYTWNSNELCAWAPSWTSLIGRSTSSLVLSVPKFMWTSCGQEFHIIKVHSFLCLYFQALIACFSITYQRCTYFPMKWLFAIFATHLQFAKICAQNICCV